MIGIKNHRFTNMFKTSNQNTAAVKEIFNNVVHFLTSPMDERSLLEINSSNLHQTSKQQNRGRKR